MEYAGFWIRTAAYIIDCIIVTILIGLAMVLLMAIGIVDFSAIMALAEDPVVQAGGDPDPVQAYEAGMTTLRVIGILLLVTFGIWWLYEALLISSAMQATPGKMAMGLRVTDLDGQPIGFGRATGRFLGKVISRMIAYIGFIIVAFTERKQGLHDMMAGTLVVHG